MPTLKSKNLIYRLALPLFSPAIDRSQQPYVFGHELHRRNDLVKIIRHNHLSGGAIHIQAGPDLKTDIFTYAFHTDTIPGDHTYYRVASITKMATALLSVILMDRGFLDPYAPVSSYLPDAEHLPDLKDVQLCHLLSHTSGLSDPDGLESKLIQGKPYIETVAGSRICPPGILFHYSNLGFGLIGSVFESVLNRPLEQIFQDYLFSPLNMNATMEGCKLSENKIMPLIRVLPYRKDQAIHITSLGKKALDVPDPLHHYGHTAGSMYTDLPSLVKLILCIRDGGNPLVSS